MGDVAGELLRAGTHARRRARIDFWVAPSRPRTDCRPFVSRRRCETGASAIPIAQALGKQLKAAGSAGASRVVFVGPELESLGRVEVKTLADGAQRQVPLDQLIAQVRDHSSGSSDRPW
jgi:histidyl-tRNA synthetase